MSQPTLLITGSKGLLGTYLKTIIKDGIFIDRDEMDITNKDSIKAGMAKYKPDIVLHLAAFTDVSGAEYNKKECYRTNVWGTGELAKRSRKFIYISTEYVFDGEKGNYHEGSYPNPVNFYSLTKLLGEFEAKQATRYCVVRTLFKPRPFKHDVVPTDMWTSGDYVDIIAPKIKLVVDHINEIPKIINIGTGRKNLYELAQQTREVKPIKRINLPIRLPRDTSLDTTMWGMLGYDKCTKTND